MGSMHFRPRPKGYKVAPLFPQKVNASTIANNINSGKYNVVVFYTDENATCYAPIVKMVEGEDASLLALQLLKEWPDSEGKVQKYPLSQRRTLIHRDFIGYKNLYAKLNDSPFSYTKYNSNPRELIALVKK